MSGVGKLRALHIVQTPLESIGGSATYIREIAKHLVYRDVEVGIAAPKPRKKRIM